MFPSKKTVNDDNTMIPQDCIDQTNVCSTKLLKYLLVDKCRSISDPRNGGIFGIHIATRLAQFGATIVKMMVETWQALNPTIDLRMYESVNN